MDYLTSMKQMNSLILESMDIQDQGFISDKESDELSSKLDDVAVPTLKTNEYIVTEDIEMDENAEVPVDEMPGTDYEGDTLAEGIEQEELNKLVSVDSDPESGTGGWMSAVKYIENALGGDLPQNVKDDIFNEFFDSEDGQPLHQWNNIEADERVDVISKFVEYFKSSASALNESEEIEGAAGTSEEEVEPIMGNAETLPENLGMKNSLSAKPNLSESVIDEKPMNDAKEGSNVELKTIEHFNDVFIKEYKPQSNIKYDLDGTELKTVVTSDTYKLPRGW